MQKSFISFRWEVSSPPSQSVQLGTLLSRTAHNLEIKLREELQPTDLTTVQKLGSHEILPVPMVGEDLNELRRPFEVCAPLLKAMHHSQQLFIIHLIVALSRSIPLREEGDRIEDTLIVPLRQEK